MTKAISFLTTSRSIKFGLKRKQFYIKNLKIYLIYNKNKKLQDWKV